MPLQKPFLPPCCPFPPSPVHSASARPFLLCWSLSLFGMCALSEFWFASQAFLFFPPLDWFSFFIKTDFFLFFLPPLKRAFYSSQTRGLAMFSFTNVTAAWLKFCFSSECCTGTEQKHCSASHTTVLFSLIPSPGLLNSNSLQWHFSKSHMLYSSSPCLQQKLIVRVHLREPMKDWS